MQRCLVQTARRFAADNSGASAVEYAILVAALALAISALVYQIGDKVTGLIEKAEGIYGK
jgi:Flp pilus assembly pilin Flp